MRKRGIAHCLQNQTKLKDGYKTVVRYHIFGLKLVLGKEESPEFPAQLERGKDRVLG